MFKLYGNRSNELSYKFYAIDLKQWKRYVTKTM